MTTGYAGFDSNEEQPGGDDPFARPYRARRRTAVRVLVPLAVAAVAAAGVAVVPALASTSAPTLPQVTAQQLLAKVFADQTQALSGTVQVSTDLGIPSQVLQLAGQGGLAGTANAAGAAGGSGQSKERNGAAAADPQAKLTALLAGDHTLRVAADGPDKQRVALVEPLAEYDLIHNGDQAWAWDSASNQALHLADGPSTAKDAAGHAKDPRSPLDGVPTTPQQAAQQLLAGSAGSSDVSVAGTTTVAGRSAYQLSVKPKQSGSTIAEVKVAVDSATGTPLAVVATSTSGSTMLDAHFSDVSFTRPSASTFDFTPPKGAKVVEQAPAQHGKDEADRAQQPGSTNGAKVIGSDWTSVVSFALPATTATAPQSGSGHHRQLPSATELVKSLGKPVADGTLISTKVVNVLITDDNHVYAGAVTLPVLQAAAGVK
ncbi:outer membrane lipoprotein carrier protein LolA [Kitasatospora sp. NPDC008050]|uniref:LolA family protein n=1 Tax=Kitasatospora sp. NPDC008050 TaxID=3364021 RepID=UPI0036E1F145